MAGNRHYPPAPQIHAPDCLALPDGAEILATPQIAQAHPNAVMHNCYHFHQNRQGGVEHVSYPPHAYGPSTIKPADAVRPLCSTCRGTHEGETASPIHVQSGTLHRAPAPAASLILPGRGNPGRLILPADARPGEPHDRNQRNARFP